MRIDYFSKAYPLALVLFIVVFGKAASINATETINGQVIVKPDSGQPIQELIQGFQGTAIDSIIEIGTFLVEFPDEFPIDTVLAALRNNPHVDIAQPNHILGLPETNQISQSFPDQENPPHLEGESPSSFYHQRSLQTVSLDSAALLSQGSNVTVAVIDNGLQFDHPLFATADFVAGYDFVRDDNDPSEEPGDSVSVYGHGTFVTGLLVLAAPEIQVMPLRAFDAEGFGNSFDVVDAVYYAIENDAEVINMSFGMEENNLLLQLALQDAAEAGIVLVASVGNDGFNLPLYPAAYTGVIAVSAIDSLEEITDFSNFGNYIDVCAPGADLYSALAGAYDWGTWSGTSFAAPLVSGAVALVLSSALEISVQEMILSVRATAREDLLWGHISPPDEYYGYGCLDAYRLVLAWSRGDCNNSRQIDVSDLTYLVDYLFKGGPAPTVTQLLGDMKCDNTIDVTDISELVAFLFQSSAGNWPCTE